MRDLCDAAIEAATRAGAAQVVASAQRSTDERVVVRDGRLVEATDTETVGVWVRAVVDGGVGAAFTSLTQPVDAAAAGERAVAEARVNAILRRRHVVLVPSASEGGVWFAPAFEAAQPSLQERLGLLLDADAVLRDDGRVASTAAHAGTRTFERFTVGSEGAFAHQRWRHSGAGLSAWVTEGSLAQLRSSPGGGESGWRGGGWEVVEALDLVAAAEQCREDAIALLYAHPCPSGLMPVVLDANAVAMHLTRSPLAQFSPLSADDPHGARWTMDAIGTQILGASGWTVACDGLLDGGLGTARWDLEGEPMQRWAIVRDGLLDGAATDRATARDVGESQSRGCLASTGTGADSIVAAPNLVLDAGTGSVDELIAEVEDGIYLATHRAGSSDPARQRFAHRVEMAWRIRNGARAELVRDAMYAGAEDVFWRGLRAVAGPETAALVGAVRPLPDPDAHCPMSVLAMPARFDAAQVIGADGGS